MLASHTRGLFKQHGASRQSRIPEGSQRRKHWELSGFVFDFMRHAQLKCGWLLSEFELGLFLRKMKNERGTCGREKKAGDRVYCGKSNVYIGGECEIRQGEQRRRMDLMKNKQV